MAPRPRLRFELSGEVSNQDLNALYSQAWPGHRRFDFRTVLKRSLVYVCAFHGTELVGFVYLAWDGRQHAFLLEPTVDPNFRRRGIGTELVRQAVASARKRGVEWVHVDYDRSLTRFYRACGFVPTTAGLINLKEKNQVAKERVSRPAKSL